MENASANHARIGNVDYPLVQSRLRAWLVLEAIYSDIREAAEHGDRERFISSLFSYVSTAFSVPIEEIQDCPWFEITRAFREIYVLNQPSIKFPMLHKVIYDEKKQEIASEGYDYPQRSWYVWLHGLARAYGWNVEYISNLSIDDGIALMEEIMIDDQLEREFQWSMSQNAFAYNETTKESKFVPLERPAWMKKEIRPIKKVKIRASELPVGIVLKWDTDNNEYTQSQ